MNHQIQTELSRLDLKDPIDNAIAEGLLIAKNIIEQNEWRSVHKTPMPQGVDVLLLFDNGQISRLHEEELPFATITHWQPLPSPPKKEI